MGGGSFGLCMRRAVFRPAVKPKTRKSILKRFKVTASGKLLYKHSNRSHGMTCKSAGRKRRLRRVSVMTRGRLGRAYKAIAAAL